MYNPKYNKKNARLKEVMEEILLLSEETVDELLDKIATHISELFMIAEAVAILDLVCSFTYNLKENNYTIPIFTNNLLIRDSRHPLLEKVLKILSLTPYQVQNIAPAYKS